MARSNNSTQGHHVEGIPFLPCAGSAGLDGVEKRVQHASCVSCACFLTSKEFVQDLHRVLGDAGTVYSEQTRRRIEVPYLLEGPAGTCGLHRLDRPYHVTPDELLRSYRSVCASRIPLHESRARVGTQPWCSYWWSGKDLKIP